MFVLGHIGITLYAARAVDPEIDWRAPAVLAVAPDILDKPLAFIWPSLVNANTRNFGHTLIAWVVAAAAIAVLSKRLRLRRPWLLWACFAGHDVLDRMWMAPNPAVFLWPFLGHFPLPLRYGPIEAQTFAYNVVGELVGAALLLRLWWVAKRSGPRP